MEPLHDNLPGGAEKWSQRLGENLCQMALELHIFSRP